MNQGLRPNNLIPNQNPNQPQNNRVTRARVQAEGINLEPPGDFNIQRPLIREAQLRRWRGVEQENQINNQLDEEQQNNINQNILEMANQNAGNVGQIGQNPVGHIWPSDFLPARFSGEKNENARAHFMLYEDYLTLQNIPPDDPARVQRFASTLSGPAHIWFTDHDFADFNALRNQFLSYFCGMHTREASARQFRLIKYHPGMTVGEYLSEIRACAERLGYGQDMIRDQFLAGLPNALQIQLALQGDRPVLELVQKAQRYLDLSQPLNASGSGYDMGMSAMNEGRTENLEKNVTKLVDQMNSLVRITAANAASETENEAKSTPKSAPPIGKTHSEWQKKPHQQTQSWNRNSNQRTWNRPNNNKN